MSAPLLPQSVESERGLIARFFTNEKVVGAECVAAKISPGHFASHDLASVFSHMMAMWENSAKIDILSLTARLKDSGAWEHLPGGSEPERRGFLNDLNELFTPDSAETHISVLEDKKRRRETILLCHQIEQRAYANEDATETLVEELLNRASGIVVENEDVLTPKQLAGRIHSDLSAAHEGAQFISTGLRGIDLTAGPFQRGNVIVVCGQTGGGKSALVSSMIVKKLADYHMLVFSLEMRPELYGDRIIGAQNRVNMHNLRKKFFTGMQASKEEYDAIERTVAAVSKSRLRFTNKINTLPQIIAATKRVGAQTPLDLVALDYAQLVEVAREKGESREREVAKVSRAFKALANEMGFLGVILSQLNDEGRMRESRALAHDADAVLSIEKDEERGTGVRALKARSAPPGTFIPLRWEPEFTRFSDA